MRMGHVRRRRILRWRLRLGKNELVWVVPGAVSLESLSNALQGLLDSRFDQFLPRLATAIVATIVAIADQKRKALREDMLVTHVDV